VARVASAGSALSGVVFAVAWYLFWGTLVEARTECIIWNNDIKNCSGTPPSELHAPDGLVHGVYWAPPILSTAGIFMLNLISWEAVTEEGFGSEGVAVCARVWIVAALILMFSALGIAIWALVDDLSKNAAWHWGGINQLISTVLILLAGTLFRVVRRSGDHAI